MKDVLFGKYRVIRPLGEGAMGRVYLVQNLHLDRLEALKICTRQKETIQMLSGEAEVLKQLHHPMLPVVYDLFSEDGHLCMVMEYVEGMTLEMYLHQFGPLDEEKAVDLAMSLTEVLGYLHRQKPEIIYRDLKPSNIMLLPDGSMKLIDLGTAYEAIYGQNEERILTGTPGYSPPEQWQGGGVCKESDIYALGMVLHEMLTNINPISECQERRPVREYNRGISRSLEQIIINCTKKQPFERYHSMEQLCKELRVCRNKRRKESKGKLKYQIGLLLFGFAGIRALLPFYRGVDIKDIPFPYLEKPVFWFLVAFSYQILIRQKRKREDVRKLEKSVFLSEKKIPGLYAAVFLTIILIGGGFCMGSDFYTERDEKAIAEENELWVDMRDESGRKCLLQKDSVFSIKDKMWLELTKENLPTGISSIKMIVIGENHRVYESRVFLVENN